MNMTHDLDIVFHPSVTDEQRLAFLNVLGDLFEAAGGKGGLRIESVHQIDVIDTKLRETSARINGIRCAIQDACVHEWGDVKFMPASNEPFDDDNWYRTCAGCKQVKLTNPDGSDKDSL